MKRVLLILLLACLHPATGNAENGYELWLRYRPLPKTYAGNIAALCAGIVMPEGSATCSIIQQEWRRATQGFCVPEPKFFTTSSNEAGILYKTVDDARPMLPKSMSDTMENLHQEGFVIYSFQQKGKKRVLIAAKNEIGWLYGSFHLLQLFQRHYNPDKIEIVSQPAVDLRLLNHWDNLDRSVERGYAGSSIWNWHTLPDFVDQRYIDYARANASIGINGTVLTNVNANATVLTLPYLKKVKKLADIFRPYGIKVYLTARFSAPIEIGHLPTADPANEAVATWWSTKAKEIYSLIPDFGGFLVKANSEGQPGPQDYGRTHADGANMLARAVKPFNGIVMWRAFVYSAETPEDRHKQANLEFEPLDGLFDNNVIVQVKNGAIDFQPREPFHPLFGAMPGTSLMPEFQLTQEYLGQATHLVYLAPLFKECLDADTHRPTAGSTVKQIMQKAGISAMAGVANIGVDINWTGHHFAQSNWYAFGRLAWNPDLNSDTIASEWIRQSFGNENAVQQPLLNMMMNSREACVNYMTPFGLHHLMGTGHHYGPAPWVDDLGRADWTPVYYHRADSLGIGFDRTAGGSKALLQYSPYWQKQWGDPATMDEKYLLWFHHLPWDFRMKNGETLWNALCLRYQQGVEDVKKMQEQWLSVKSLVDAERFEQVKMLLNIQEKEARWWKDACLIYFQQYSKKPFPATVPAPEQTLEYYKSLRFPYAPGN
ncbi:MAG: alpha-glucuronidase family glycosyl hydrolase [Chitinophagaceae bacterium]